MTQDETARLLAWRRGAPIEDPPVVETNPYRSTKRMHCGCGRSFAASQFDSWYEHLDTCPERREP